MKDIFVSRSLITDKDMIGVGREWLALPLPPNRTGGSPASGSPVGSVNAIDTFLHEPLSW